MSSAVSKELVVGHLTFFENEYHPPEIARADDGHHCDPVRSPEIGDLHDNTYNFIHVAPNRRSAVSYLVRSRARLVLAPDEVGIKPVLLDEIGESFEVRSQVLCAADGKTLRLLSSWACKAQLGGVVSLEIS